MTDEQIMFRWQRSTRDMKAIRILSELSLRKQTDIIHLLALAGLMKGGWANGTNRKAEGIRYQRSESLQGM